MNRLIGAAVTAAGVLAAATAGAGVGLTVGGGSMIIPDKGYDPFSGNDSFGVGLVSVDVAPFPPGPLAGLGFDLGYQGGGAGETVWDLFDAHLELNLLQFGARYRYELTEWFVPYGRLACSIVWAGATVDAGGGLEAHDTDTAFGGAASAGFEVLMPRSWLYRDAGRKDAWYKLDTMGLFFEAGYGFYSPVEFARASVPAPESDDPEKEWEKPVGPSLGGLSLSGPLIRAGFVAKF